MVKVRHLRKETVGLLEKVDISLSLRSTLNLAEKVPFALKNALTVYYLLLNTAMDFSSLFFSALKMLENITQLKSLCPQVGAVA